MRSQEREASRQQGDKLGRGAFRKRGGPRERACCAGTADRNEGLAAAMAGAGAAKLVNQISDDGQIHEEQNEFGNRGTFEELVDFER